MDILLLVARLLLAGTLLIAGVAKLRDKEGTRDTLLAFGAPASLALPLAAAIPLAELVAAGLLLASPTATWGAAMALGFLTLFTMAIVSNLRAGRKPDCRCFGQLSSAPISRWTVARNGLLGLLATLVLWGGPGASIGGMLQALSTIELLALLLGIAIVALLAANAWLLYHTLRQQGRMLLRLEALESQQGRPEEPITARSERSVGEAAPTFRLVDLGGNPVSLESLLAKGEGLVLVFLEGGCRSCEALLPDIRVCQHDQKARVTVAAVLLGRHERLWEQARKHGLEHVLHRGGRRLAELYGVRRMPSAVLVRSDGTVGSHVGEGAAAVKALLAAAPAGAAGPPHDPTRSGA